MAKSIKPIESAGDEDEIDGCSIDFLDSDPTVDEELPASAGGVEIVESPDDNSEDVCGCDLEFNDDDITTDEQLPAAIGGVA